jgi:hypothetical protein
LSVQGKISQDDYYALLGRVDELYGILERLQDMWQRTLDDNVHNMYFRQLATYTGHIERIRSINPELIRLKCREVLEEAARLWTKHTVAWEKRIDADGNEVTVTAEREDGLTAEVVAKHVFLLDVAQALGWESSEPPSVPSNDIPCYRSVQRLAGGKAEKQGHCRLAERRMLSSCICQPEHCLYYQEVKQWKSMLHR